MSWYALEVDDEDAPQERGGVHVWDPRVRVYRHEGGTVHRIAVRLCPGYVFVGSWRGWVYVERALGVRLVRFGGSPSPVPPWEVRRLAENEDRDLHLRPMFRRGQPVRVAARARTAFAGMAARFQREVRTEAGTFARLVVDLYGEARRTATVPIDYLEAF